MSSFALITLVNDRAQFEGCRESLRRQVDGELRWLAIEPNASGWNAAQGLNRGLDELDSDWTICVHQDVLFPDGFWSRFTSAISELDGNVVLAGVAGCERNGAFRGHLVDPNGHCFWGPLPALVLTLDEVLIAVRRSSGLRFCEEVPGFHCYGAELCLRAAAAGQRSVVVDAPLVHLSTGRIDLDYERSGRWLLERWGEAHGHVLPMPALSVQDEERAGFWRKLRVRWQRRQDRIRRNTNDCGDADCSARRMARERSGSSA